MAIHLKIDGIEGDSVDSEHTNWIDIESWSWGASNHSDSAYAGGLSQTTSQVQDMALSTVMGKASVNLLYAACTGQHFGEIILHCTKQTGDLTPKPWLIITLTDAMITSVNQSGSSQGGAMDSMTISYKKYKQEYKIQNKDGTVSNGGEKTYNVAEGKGEK